MEICTEAQSIATSRESRLMIWLEGCGAGILLMLSDLRVHLSPLHADLYHRRLPMNTIYGALAIDLVLVCLFSTGVLWLLERWDADGRTFWWTLVAAVASYRILIFITWVGASHQHLDRALIGFLLLACIAAGPALWIWKRAWYRSAVRAMRVGLALLGVCIFWMLPQVVYMAIRPESRGIPNFARAVSAAQQPHRRIIWILFDELSQNQVFDNRQPGISLPQLDQFRAQSVMFSNIQPAGFYTEKVLPSLLRGRIITDERTNLSGNFFVRASRGWQLFSAGKTLFADAQRAGWSTGVAGWYNPYCRTYQAYLDWCAWTLRAPIQGNYRQEQSLWWNIKAPFIPAAMLAGRADPDSTDAAEHAADYNDLMRWSHELIDDDNIGFVFLHLPLPHPGGFYSRTTGQLGVNGSYLDNLVLTDRSLGELMQWISQTPLASKTTVIICSDHSWRVRLWRITQWTKEDEQVSGGRFDPRPVLMVHFPGQTTPEVVSQPFPAIKEHDMIESLLHQPMTAAGLEDWARRQSSSASDTETRAH